MAKVKKEEHIEIVPIQMGTSVCHIVGNTPMIMHRFSKKAREQLLFPKGRANAAEKAENLKHDPLNEFRECIYLNRDENEPSAIHLPADSFSKGMAAAALDMPGASKSQILRLVSLKSTQINLFGVPQMTMDMVRSSDMAKTPDVRTRAIFPEWACAIEVEYVSTLLKQTQIINLLAAAGMIVGIGDWRPQKGGSYGKFRIVEETDTEYRRILRDGSRKAQLAAIKEPIAFSADTEELFAWFQAEAARREKHIPSNERPVKARKGKVQVPAVAPVAAKAKLTAARRRGNGAHKAR